MNYYYYYYHHFSIVSIEDPHDSLLPRYWINKDSQPTNKPTSIQFFSKWRSVSAGRCERFVRPTKKKWKKQIRKERNQRNCYHENGRDIRDSTNLGPVTDFPIGRNQKFHPSDRNAIHNQWSTMHDPLHPIIYPFSQFQHTRDDIPNSRNPQNPLQTNETKFIVSNSKIEFKL